MPQSKGKQGQQSKVDGAVYVDDNPNANLFTKPKTTTPPSQVRVRAAGSPAKVPQAPTLDELKQRKGLEPTFTTKEGWKRFPARRRPGKYKWIHVLFLEETNGKLSWP